jgi:hypothetical protein
MSMIQRPIKGPLVLSFERSEVIIRACCTMACDMNVSVLLARSVYLFHTELSQWPLTTNSWMVVRHIWRKGVGDTSIWSAFK